MSQPQAVEASTVVNGINVDDVEALIETVAGAPEEGQTRWKVTSRWQGGTRVRAEVESFHMAGAEVKRPFAIDIDEPAELGGTNTNPNPQEYLLAALNACMTVGYTVLCSVRGITLEKLEIETEGDIDLRGFLGLDPAVSPGYDSLTYKVTIKGDASAEEFAKIHEIVQATSPNFHNISRPVALKPALVVE
jgi:uncharacterized OsmC-like protein